ncbi:GIY-YIG nuclease family protein [Corynebacterium aurimucosum]|uniref:GIY-YIG nuclease family protein n=1 Tax=Corynebacterium aurimucosum TaxID=169292 RepID=UPI001D0D128A|nr:GIY-YIG nuclease family protein [Corynebacterium aurimucosum]
MASPLDFKRLELDSNTPIGPIFPANERCGIYVIEFDDGTKYVGQTIDIVKRFRNHTHGSKHHESWGDVVALSFAPAPPLELDILEKQVIQSQLSARVLLRNRSGVLASEGPSPLDLVVTVTEQKHWVLGDWEPSPSDRAAFVRAAEASAPTKLQKNASPEVAKAVIKDIAFALEHIIPVAPETERTYWTLSDYPSTAGGRYATLNTGILEFLVFPRSSVITDPTNLDLGFLDGYTLGTGFFNLLPREGGDWKAESDTVWFSKSPYHFVASHDYNVTPTEAYYYPIGQLEETFNALGPEMLSDARKFAVTLMRNRPSNLFRRWHSSALAGRAYESIVKG